MARTVFAVLACATAVAAFSAPRAGAKAPVAVPKIEANPLAVAAALPAVAAPLAANAFQGSMLGMPINLVVAFAPGRANLIGEHTDYQDGLVMPFALDVGVYVAFRARSDDALNVFAEDFNAWGATTLGAVRAARAADPAYGPAMDPKWLRYVAAPFDWLRFGADGTGRCARCLLYTSPSPRD